MLTHSSDYLAGPVQGDGKSHKNPAGRWMEILNARARQINTAQTWIRYGRITRATGMMLEATGVKLGIGAPCYIELSREEGQWQEARVVGFDRQTIYLMPLAEITGLQPNARVRSHEGDGPPNMVASSGIIAPQATNPTFCLPVGEGLLGRVVDGAGRPLDRLGKLHAVKPTALNVPYLNPLERESVDSILDVGVRAINGLLTVGRGQRIGLFAGSGVGKSVLLGMMARSTQADVVVVALIGERNREVRDFVTKNLGTSGLQRAIVVVAPADVSPVLRMQAATYATRLAEHFRDLGRHVLLIMDSLTRYAMAQREIALALGEPPATKGYPPSVFAALPALVERAGNGVGHGSITAIYTVLAEADDQQDPIADCARAILDGHIVLSRRLSECGHYPAIDVEASVSRVMADIVPASQLSHAHHFKRLLSSYQRNRDLIAVGAYVPGSDVQIDEAMSRYPQLEAYLRQSVYESSNYEESVNGLTQLFPTHRNPPEGAATHQWSGES